LSGGAGRSLAAFWRRAYEENVTGMAAMVAYNLLLSVFPFALLLLFITGQLLQSPDVQSSILNDLQELFPSTEQDTLRSSLEQLSDNSTQIGIVAIVAGLWIGSSFWGAMDTAFCRIYHVECRSWLKQKRFALIMLAVSAFFLAASVAVPAVESLLVSGVEDLPFGLSRVDWLLNVMVIAGGLTISFLILCLIYWAVPKGHLPWRAVWPGALFMALAGGIANTIFPIYLVNISTVGEFGRIVSFVLIVLIWFYAVALGLLAGAVVNSLRFELHATGTVRGMTADFPAQQPAAEEPEHDWLP
jgi:YihY family inner membrane protein